MKAALAKLMKRAKSEFVCALLRTDCDGNVVVSFLPC